MQSRKNAYAGVLPTEAGRRHDLPVPGRKVTKSFEAKIKGTFIWKVPFIQRVEMLRCIPALVGKCD